MIRLAKPFISYDEVEREFRDVFRSGWFTKGKYTDIFRNKIKEYIDVDHVFLTTSGTTALWVCLKALNITKKDEVIISDFSYPATAHVVEDLDAIPIFADVDLNTFNMSTTELERKITDKTKAVIYVDALGNPSGINAIKEICQHYKLPLIEDAACSMGSSESGKRCGSISDFTCFSFHPRKLLTTGEGGAITTNNTNLSKLLEVKLNQGAVPREDKFEFIDYGYNFRMSELQAIMGIKQLPRLDNIIKNRNKIRNEYIKYLEPLGFVSQHVMDDVVYNVQSIVFKVPKKVRRNELIKKLKLKGIESTLGTYCLSNTEYYKSKYNTIQSNAKFLGNNTITFPCYEGINVQKVITAVQLFC